MKILQRIALGTALISGLVGCSAGKVPYEPIRDGLILQNQDSDYISCQDFFRYDSQRPIFGNSLDNFYIAGLINKGKTAEIANETSVWLIFPTKAFDPLTGEHLTAKPCILQKEIFKGKA